jgi:hypothetical protein
MDRLLQERICIGFREVRREDRVHNAGAPAGGL